MAPLYDAACLPPGVLVVILAALGCIFIIESNPRRALALATKIYRFNAKPVIPCRGFHEDTGELICPNLIRGIDHLRDPRLNKGLSFTIEERQQLGIHGLLAARVTSVEDQLEQCRIAVDRFENFLNKYIYLADLQDRNERLFFKLLSTDIEKYLPILYTPTVGLACQRFGLIYRRPRGLFITIQDKGHVFSILKNWPENDIRAICFTDGERILGLGDLGAYGMGIPVGKLALYTALAGIKPHQCLPVTLDVGTNNKELLEDPLYIGIRRTRVSGKEYADFLDEFMEACVERYGHNVLLQFEDFALANAAPLLKRYRDRYCTFNDDIQGTAAVSVAGLIAATRITKRKMSENVYLYLGAGSASNGIASLSVMAMMEEGLTLEDARARIYMFDIDGLLTSKRKGGVPELSKDFGKDIEPETNLEAAVTKLKATVLIGASTVGGAFTPKIINQMAKNCDIPIIFALSNPTSKAECSAQEAYDHTNGSVVYASGSPFPPVQYKNKTYVTGQGNNSYIFPGVALGVIATETHHIDDSMFLCAARTLANIVAESDISMGRIYPPLSEVNEVSLEIAIEVAKLAYAEGVAGKFPKPKDDQRMRDLVIHAKYDPNYKRFGTEVYKWPEEASEILSKVKTFDTVAEKYGVKMDGKPLDKERLSKPSIQIKTTKSKTKEHRVRKKAKHAKKIREEFMQSLKVKSGKKGGKKGKPKK